MTLQKWFQLKLYNLKESVPLVTIINFSGAVTFYCLKKEQSLLPFIRNIIFPQKSAFIGAPILLKSLKIFWPLWNGFLFLFRYDKYYQTPRIWLTGYDEVSHLIHSTLWLCFVNHQFPIFFFWRVFHVLIFLL